MDSVIVWDVGKTLFVPKYDDTTMFFQTLNDANIPNKVISLSGMQRAVAFYREKFLKWRNHTEEIEGYHQIAKLMISEKIDNRNEYISRLSKTLYNYYDKYEPVEGIEEILINLKSRDIKLGILSDWPPSLRMFLDYHNLSKYFDFLTISSEIGITKPSKDIYISMLNSIKSVELNQILYIGNDLNLDIIPAKRLGINAIHFNPYDLEGGGIKKASILSKEIDDFLRKEFSNVN